MQHKKRQMNALMSIGRLGESRTLRPAPASQDDFIEGMSMETFIYDKKVSICSM